ncbi:uncharacterized protein [Halyomorpha halys]|uniref:uncharacterized protein n=1 Tax=Halyomorpha halys TaxID=286706 RepID=UPI000D0C75C4|nr:uncharacterized protein LOC112210336 [Halyomorpha halys]
MQAIRFAMEAIIKSDDNTVIFSDSQAVIQKLSTPGITESTMKEKCRNMSAIIEKRGRIIALQWIPGHVGIYGNEQAEKLAKLGCAENQPLVLVRTRLSYRTVKSIITSYCKDRTSARHKFQTEGRKWESLQHKDKQSPGNLSRAEGVACFRLVTGHDLLLKYLH